MNKVMSFIFFFIFITSGHALPEFHCLKANMSSIAAGATRLGAQLIRQVEVAGCQGALASYLTEEKHDHINQNSCNEFQKTLVNHCSINMDNLISEEDINSCTERFYRKNISQSHRDKAEQIQALYSNIVEEQLALAAGPNQLALQALEQFDYRCLPSNLKNVLKCDASSDQQKMNDLLGEGLSSQLQNVFGHMFTRFGGQKKLDSSELGSLNDFYLSLKNENRGFQHQGTFYIQGNEKFNNTNTVNHLGFYRNYESLEEMRRDVIGMMDSNYQKNTAQNKITEEEFELYKNETVGILEKKYKFYQSLGMVFENIASIYRVNSSAEMADEQGEAFFKSNEGKLIRNIKSFGFSDEELLSTGIFFKNNDGHLIFDKAFIDIFTHNLKEDLNQDMTDLNFLAKTWKQQIDFKLENLRQGCGSLENEVEKLCLSIKENKAIATHKSGLACSQNKTDTIVTKTIHRVEACREHTVAMSNEVNDAQGNGISSYERLAQKVRTSDEVLKPGAGVFEISGTTETDDRDDDENEKRENNLGNHLNISTFNLDNSIPAKAMATNTSNQYIKNSNIESGVIENNKILRTNELEPQNTYQESVYTSYNDQQLSDFLQEEKESLQEQGVSTGNIDNFLATGKTIESLEKKIDYFSRQSEKGDLGTKEMSSLKKLKSDLEKQRKLYQDLKSKLLVDLAKMRNSNGEIEKHIEEKQGTSTNSNLAFESTQRANNNQQKKENLTRKALDDANNFEGQFTQQETRAPSSTQQTFNHDDSKAHQGPTLQLNSQNSSDAYLEKLTTSEVGILKNVPENIYTQYKDIPWDKIGQGEDAYYLLLKEGEFIKFERINGILTSQKVKLDENKNPQNPSYVHRVVDFESVIP